ncbi:MAG TPA: DUF1232 domain-containing protein [Phycisphaerae bacterium]|jgi:uncharacterized membrane protein YkvA (DUF1232 family)|nr:DUF1232 domain-containing protein [Phycisphaerae bacterium]HOB72910.1 DUF1232 domain-containing protein [Phycisphaerae bacterium]HOJ53041.1 DUF1232 domain-containing protein [Phycisphaerae bacterium]HOL24778.1 DUF1232 domain-containing protein [Phycisphaerae bacterium]HPP19314.1 DUF1232 domain-containing protein [Phycisphaerae bacterium]
MSTEGQAGEYHAVHYADTSFWKKLRRHSRRIGRSLVQKALELYYVLQSRDLPPRVRLTILGALGYLIFPLDAIPDLLPGAGYSDDLAAVVAALAVAAAHITPEMRMKAFLATNRLLGDAPQPDLEVDAGE